MTGGERPRCSRPTTSAGSCRGELTPALAREIGRALVATIQPDTVVVGRDMRVSSPLLAAALIEGIRDAGADVVDVGMVSTDALSFAIGKYGYPAGVMVTASHNPPGIQRVQDLA